MPRLLSVAAAVAGAGATLWILGASWVTATALGGTPHAVVLSLFSVLGGVAAGDTLCRHIRLPRLMTALLPAVAMAGTWYLFETGGFPIWDALWLNLLVPFVSHAAVGCGLSRCHPPGTPTRAASSAIALTTLVAPFAWSVAGAGALLALGCACLVTAMVFFTAVSPGSSEAHRAKRDDTAAPTFRWIPRILAVGMASGLIVAAIHVLESGRLPHPGTAWWAAGVLVLLVLGVPRIRIRTGDGSSRRSLCPPPLGWLIAGLAASSILAAAPVWPVRGVPQGATGLPDPWTVLLLVVTAAGVGAVVSTRARDTKPDASVQNLLMVSLAAILWELTATPRLGTEGMLRFLGATGLLLAAVAGVILFRRKRGNLFTYAAFSVAAGGLTLWPLLAPPWNPAPAWQEAFLPSRFLESRTPPPPLFYQEDQNGPVVAYRDKSVSRLFVRGYPTVSRPPSDTDPFLALLPSLLQARTEQVLVTGDGAGARVKSLLSLNPIRLVWLSESLARAAAVHTLVEDAPRVMGDPRLVVDFGSLRRLSRRGRQKFEAISVLAPPLNTLEREHLYSLQGLHALKRLLAPGGAAVVELPLDGGEAWVRRVLATFHTVFPEGMVWLCPQASSSLALTAGEGQAHVSIATLEKRLNETAVARALRRADLGSVEDVLEYLLLTPAGLASLKEAPLSDLAPISEHSTKGGKTVLATLLPALRPLADVVDPRGSKYQPEAILAVLDEIVEHHRAYLTMLAELNRGMIANVVAEAHKLTRGPRSRHSELDILTRPYLDRAREYLRTGQVDRAIEQLSVVRLVDARRPDVPLLLGQAYEQKGQVRQAESFYRDALRLAPDATEAKIRLAGLYQDAQRYREAIALLENVMSAEPPNATVLNNLGALHLAAGDIEKAKEYFEQAIQLDQQLATAHTGLAEILFKLGRDDAAAVEADIAVRLDPTPDALNLLGQIALRQGDLDRAKAAFLRCLLKNPDHIAARGAMGIIAARQGDVDTARKSWEKVLQMDPDNRAAKENLKRLDEVYPALPYDSSRPGSRHPMLPNAEGE